MRAPRPNLLTLFRFACERVEDLPLTEEAVERAIQVFANTWTVPEDHWPLLPEIHRTKERGDLHEAERFYQESWAILEAIGFKDAEIPRRSLERLNGQAPAGVKGS